MFIDLFKLLNLHCHFLNIHNIAVIGSDAQISTGLPIIVYDHNVSINNIRIHAGLVWHTNFDKTLKKVDVHRSLSGWFGDSIVLLLTEEIPHMKLFENLLNKGILRIVIITTTQKIYSYNPFSGQLHLHCNFEEIWSDMNGRAIKMSAFYDQLGYTGIGIGHGMDGSFMFELSRHINLTPVIIEINNYEDGLRNIQMGLTEMTLNAFFLCFNHKNLTTTTHAMYSDQECVAMRKGKILRGWHVFLQTFDWEVWLAIFVAALVTNLAVACVSKGRGWHEAMPLTLRAMFMIPLRRPPICTKERLILGGCLLFGIVIVTSYQGSLYHLIKAKVKHQTPETLDEIELQVIDGHSMNQTVTNEIFEKYAVRIRRKLFDLMLNTGQLVNVLLVPQCICTGSLGYQLKSGSPLLDHINRFILRTSEAGLPLTWYRRTVYQIGRRGDKLSEENNVRALTLRDVEVSFFALFLGFSISFVALLMEFLSYMVASRHSFCNSQFYSPHIYIN